jgi:transketolase
MAVGTKTGPTLDQAFLADLASQLRVDSIRAAGNAGSGHPTSSLSAADLLAVLLARHLRYDWSAPDNPANDHLIFSKGHATPLLYATFKAAGAISDDELVNTYRKAGSRLQGHPTPAIPWVDVATGSLGQGLPICVGIGLAGRYLDHLPYHVYALCGDSEMAEGSIWEALDKASHYRLGNLTVLVDVNRLGQRGPTELEWDLPAYQRRVEAFGCRALCVDGHDLAAIDAALAEARADDAPTVVLARTVKGKGVPDVEDRNGYHGKPLKPDVAERAIAALGGVRQLRVEPNPPESGQPRRATGQGTVELPTYERGAKVPTRKAYGDTLRALGVRPEIVALDGEVADSTHSEEFAEAFPDRYFEMYISEQQMIAAAVGLQVRGYRPFASTFAAFLTRAFDFVRMAAISRADMSLSGSHAGTEIGADGPSQMALEDLAMMRAVHGSTVLYPSDAVSCAALTAAMADQSGISYLRTTRGGYPVLYDNGDAFPVGGSRMLRDGDGVTLAGAGVTVHNCLAAAQTLDGEGISARVLDLYSVKPVDRAALVDAVRATGGRIVVVEDHYPQGGLGSAVLEALADLGEPVRLTQLAVRDLPGSGTSAELMDAAGIGPDAIVAAARALA